MSLDLNGDIYRSSRNSEVAVCLIPATYVGMHSPVLGPASSPALGHCGGELLDQHLVGPDSEVWPLIHV
jgi:hypothetical protein